MKDLLSPKQVARSLGVSESSLKRWCDKGLLPITRTAGGHRRLPVNAVLAFIRKAGHEIVCPEELGLPSRVGSGILTLQAASQALRQSLLSGDEQQSRRIIFDLYLAGRTAFEICDQVIAESLRGVGDAWECREAEVFEEHRACEIVSRLLYELRRILPTISSDAPLAVGGSIEGDPYRMPTTMVEITLREAGWNAESYGASLPVDTMCAAIEKTRPRLFWLSASSLQSVPEFLTQWSRLFQVAADCGAATVVGGKALTPDVRAQMQYAAFCDNLRHLVSFVTSLRPLP